MTDIAKLVAEYQQISAAHEADSKKFNTHWKPAVERKEAIQALITAAMTEQGIKSFKTDTGTAILSEINTAKIKPEERDAYIDYCMDNWQEIGGELLQIGAPKAEAVRNYMNANKGALPPHIEMSTFLRCSIRKT